MSVSVSVAPRTETTSLGTSASLGASTSSGASAGVAASAGLPSRDIGGRCQAPIPCGSEPVSYRGELGDPRRIDIAGDNRPADLAAVAMPTHVTRSLFADLIQLTKPRILTMVLVTTVIAGLIAAGGIMPATLWLHLIIGVGLVAGSAGAMNQVWEQRVDQLMARTRQRPLAAGRIGFTAGLLYASLLGLSGSLYLWSFTGAIPALVAVATWVTYVPIYTPLKQLSEWNTTVGAISGALPMLIGYTAAGGTLYDPVGWLLVAVLVAWQYPHFMAIAWRCRHEYAAAGFQMTTTVEPTGKRAGRQSVGGMLFLNVCLLALVGCLVGPAIGPATIVVSLVMLAVTYPMTRAAFRFAQSPDDGTARKLLRTSIVQLPTSLFLLTVAALVWGR